MRYRINEVAKLLNITDEAIRYYETKGIINPARSEDTGYRYYGVWEIHMLIRARSYRKLGYSLEETAKMLNDYKASVIFSKLSSKEKEIEDEIIKKMKMLRYIRTEKEVIKDAYESIERYSIEYRPALYRLDMQDGYQLHHGKCIHSLIKRWTQNTPFLFSSALFPSNKLQKELFQFSFGLGIYEDYINPADLSQSRYISYFPSELCVHTVIQSTSEEALSLKSLMPALKYLKSQGLMLTGDILSKSILMNKIENKYVNLHQIWLPVNLKESKDENSDRRII